MKAWAYIAVVAVVMVTVIGCSGGTSTPDVHKGHAEGSTTSVEKPQDHGAHEHQRHSHQKISPHFAPPRACLIRFRVQTEQPHRPIQQPVPTPERHDRCGQFAWVAPLMLLLDVREFLP